MVALAMTYRPREEAGHYLRGRSRVCRRVFIAGETGRHLHREGVMSLPTIQVFVGGELVKQFVGAKPKSAFAKAVEEFI